MAIYQIKRVSANQTYDDINLKTTANAIDGFDECTEDVFNDVCETQGFVKKPNIYLTRRELHTTNPVLEDGQLAIESDTGRTKIGDGSTVYSLLNYQK
jgi:hypothetical protein